jgi:phage tail-like protein
MGLIQKIASAAANMASVGLLQSTSTVPADNTVVGKPLTNLEEYPIPTYQFSIKFGGDTVALFQSVKGLSVTREVEPLKVGGENNFGREFPGHISFGHVTFEVGLTSSNYFWDWMVAGQLDGYANSRDFTLIQRRPNPAGGSPLFEEVRKWNFDNAFPVSWKLSDLVLDDSQKIVIESLELSFDFFEVGK